MNHIGQIIDVIQCLHQNWFVHFDIKPENVVLHDGRIKLIDAGSLTYVNVNVYNNIVYVRGTDFYMAPELQGKTKVRAAVAITTHTHSQLVQVIPNIMCTY
jgi:serine/threonine protein kinase